jgi:hypothetical protein
MHLPEQDIVHRPSLKYQALAGRLACLPRSCLSGPRLVPMNSNRDALGRGAAG